jgi:integrase
MGYGPVALILVGMSRNTPRGDGSGSSARPNWHASEMPCEQRRRDQSATPWTIAAIRLLTLTGARLNEILTLEWKYVSEEHGLLLLPDSKTGRKAVHLSPPALAVLQATPRLGGRAAL